MARVLSLVFLTMLFAVPIWSASSGIYIVDSGASNREAHFGHSPAQSWDLGFIENRGQWDSDVRFVAATPFGAFGASGSAIYLDIKDDRDRSSGQVLRMDFPGSTFREPYGEGELDTSITFLLGKKGTGTNTRGYGRLVYGDLWPGIDLIISLQDDRPKYEFLLNPGVDPSSIAISVDGHLSLSLVDGAIEIAVPGGEDIIDSAPTAYNVGSDRQVDVRYRIMDDRSYGFIVSDFNRAMPLVIDPLLYSTFVGGGGWDQGKSIVTDDDGNAYICGHTDSMDLPTTLGAYDEHENGNIDGFAARLSGDGSSLDWCTFFGGSSDDYCHELALLGSAELVLCGHTYSEDLPVTIDAFDGTHEGSLDTFAAVLSTDGRSLNYCTYLGGQDKDYAYSIAVDHMGVITIAGCTYSSDIPTTEGAYQKTSAGDADCLVYSFSKDRSIRFITYLGGGSEDKAYDVTVDAKGRTWIAGITSSSDYPTTEGAFDRTFNGGADAFLTEIDVLGSSLVGSSYYGSTGSECANSIAISRSGSPAIAGRTTSNGLTMSGNAFDASFNGKADGFVAGFDPDIRTIAFSTYIGGTEVEDITGIALDGSGNIYFTGYSSSADFPTTADALSGSHSGGFFDEVIAVLDADSTDLVYSTYLGGSSDFDYLYDISVNDTGYLFAIGNTASNEHLTTVGAYDRAYSGNEDVVVVTMNADLPYPPTPPRNLETSVKDDAIQLDWEPPNNGGTTALIGYDVYRGEDPYSMIPITKDFQGTKYNDQALSVGKTYHYMVRAKNDIGSSRCSNIASALFVTVPSPPRDLTASVGPHHVSLSWSAPEGDGGTPLTGYEVWRSNPGVPSSMIASTEPSSIEYNDSSVVQGIEYTFEVAAVNLRGPSHRSSGVAAIPMERPAPPSDLSAKAGDGYVLLTWSPPISNGGSPLIEFEVWRFEAPDQEKTNSLGPAETAFNDTSVVNGLTYTYHMTARNLAGRSECSMDLSVVPAGLPDPPMNLIARSGNGFVQLIWQAPMDDGGFEIIAYNILRSLDGSEPSKIGSKGGSETSFNDTDVDNGNLYTYWLAAQTAIGISSMEGPAEAIPIGPPDPPRDVCAIPGDGFALITWLPPTNDGGSPVDRFSVLRGISSNSMRVIASLGNGSFLYNDTDVTNGIPFYYAVRAFNPYFGSEPSGPVEIIPSDRPDPPTDVMAALVSGLIHITWNPPEDDGGSALECYRIFRAMKADPEDDVIEFGPGILNFIDDDPTLVGTVSYSLTCRNGIGESGYSEKISVTIPEVPGKAVSLNAVLSDGKVSLTWVVPAGVTIISYYKVYKTQGSDTILIGMTTGSQTSFIDPTPIPGRSVYFVRAVNDQGMGEPSENIEVSIPRESRENDNSWLLLLISIVLLIISCGVLSILLIHTKNKNNTRISAGQRE